MVGDRGSADSKWLVVGDRGGADSEWLVVGDCGRRRFGVVGGWQSWAAAKGGGLARVLLEF